MRILQYFTKWSIWPFWALHREYREGVTNEVTIWENIKIIKQNLEEKKHFVEFQKMSHRRHHMGAHYRRKIVSKLWTDWWNNVGAEAFWTIVDGQTDRDRQRDRYTQWWSIITIAYMSIMVWANNIEILEHLTSSSYLL